MGDNSRSHFRLPKPFEIGALFSTIPERLMRYMMEKDDNKTAGRAVLRMFSDTFAFQSRSPGVSCLPLSST